MTIDEKVMNYYSGWKSIRNEEKGIENRKTELRKEKIKLHEEADKIKKMMETNEFSDPVLKYCFIKYEDEGEKKLWEIRGFIEAIKKNTGSKLLVFNEGGKGHSTAIGREEWNIPYEVIIGRLIEPCIKSNKYNNIIACVKNPKTISQNSSIGFIDYKPEIKLDYFADMYKNINYDVKKGPENGFQIDIPVPFKIESSIGGSRTYNSNIISKLIVGDERVDKFLNSFDFKVYVEAKAKIPEI